MSQTDLTTLRSTLSKQKRELEIELADCIFEHRKFTTPIELVISLNKRLQLEGAIDALNSRLLLTNQSLIRETC